MTIDVMREDALVRSRAPLRLSFAGGGTDVPPFPALEGGSVLSATIDRYAYCSLRPRNDGNIILSSRGYYGSPTSSDLATESQSGNMLDYARAAIRRLVPEGSDGFDLSIQCDGPPGSGLGASSALMVALVGLLNESFAVHLSDYDIANMAWILEREDLGLSGGSQDQYAAAFGGFNQIDFFSNRVDVETLRISPDIVNELHCNLLLCNTGINRFSSRIIDDQTRRLTAGDPESISALRELKALVGEMKRALLRRRFEEFGRLLHEEWKQKQRLSPMISTGEIDQLYALACAEGALGGKVTGAGGGGHLLLYCDFERKPHVAGRMSEAGCTVSQFSFEPHGLETWRVRSVPAPQR